METPAASFDHWTILFLIVSAFGLFFSFLLFSRVNRNFSLNWPIATLLFGYAIVLLHYTFFWTGYIRSFPFIALTTSAWYLSFGPLLYLYVARLANRSPYIFPHFIPALVALIASGLVLWMHYDPEIFRGQATFRSIVMACMNPWIGVASMVLYSWRVYLVLSAYKRSWHSAELRLLYGRWLNWLTGSFLVFALAYSSYFILVQFPFFDLSWDYSIAFTMSFSIYLVGFFTYNEPRIFNGEGFFPELSPKPHTAHDAPMDTFEEIRGHIAQGKWFTEPELRLAHVAERTGWSMHDVSRAVNACAGKNFNQWINEFRIEYAKELLVHDDALSIKEICHACGFNSKSAFFNAFRSVTGQTPREFKSRQHA